MAKIVSEDDKRYPLLLKELDKLRARYIGDGDKRPKIQEHTLGSIAVYTVTFFGSDEDAIRQNKRYTHYVVDRNGAWTPIKDLNDVVYEVSGSLRQVSFWEANFTLVVTSAICALISVLIFTLALQTKVPPEIVTTPLTALLAFLAGKGAARNVTHEGP